LVHDICLVRQFTTSITVRFDDAAIANFFDEHVDQGLKPDSFARIWIHTHPGASAQPSLTDEETFARCFGRSDWAVMAILAKSGQAFARLQVNVGPKAGIRIPIDIDYGCAFPQTNQKSWIDEYDRFVGPEPIPRDWGKDQSPRQPLVAVEQQTAGGWR
jgi:hypothetical protein